MKKFILLFSICFFFSNAHAQLTTRVEAGINLATNDFSNTTIFQNETIENRTGYYLAFIPKIYLTEKIAVNVEVQYSEEGYRLNDDDNFEAKFQYLRLLPQIEIKLMDALGIYGGYNWGFKIDEHISIFDSGFATPALDTIKKTDNGFTVGARVYIGKFSLTGKYNFGIQNITDLTYTDDAGQNIEVCLLYTSPSPRDQRGSRMPSSA